MSIAVLIAKCQNLRILEFPIDFPVRLFYTSIMEFRSAEKGAEMLNLIIEKLKLLDERKLRMVYHFVLRLI